MQEWASGPAGWGLGMKCLAPAGDGKIARDGSSVWPLPATGTAVAVKGKLAALVASVSVGLVVVTDPVGPINVGAASVGVGVVVGVGGGVAAWPTLKSIGAPDSVLPPASTACTHQR